VNPAVEYKAPRDEQEPDRPQLVGEATIVPRARLDSGELGKVPARRSSLMRDDPSYVEKLRGRALRNRL